MNTDITDRLSLIRMIGVHPWLISASVLINQFLMSRRNRFLITAGAVGIAVALFIPSLTVRAVAAALVLAVGLSLVVLGRRVSRALREDTHRTDDTTAEIFAFGKLFEATMGGMREGLLVVNKDMRVVASNTAAHRLVNPTRGPLEGQRLTELTRNPDIYDAFLDALKGIERSGVKIQTYGPERLIFDLRVVPLGGGGGGGNGSGSTDTRSTQGALGVFIDVTRIERLEQVRQEFLSNVSHELRTPLTAILAFVETLESGAIENSAARSRFLPIIRKSATRMQHLIDDILELSAIEAGNVQVSAEPVELHPIVNDVVSSLAAKADAEGIEVINAVPGDATVYADARRLEQMLTNLVDNAIKFNRQHGQVKIRHESVPLVQEEGFGGGPSPVVGRQSDRIIVEDTGEGIPSQHLERLFERFYRVDRARSREMGGTGLGLAIVKHLALAHDGEVTVTSQLGKGSTFTIELPSATRHMKEEQG
jgi:two-component system, OmpR family, phosphate regulon sensor histidine kinase PhoR